MGESEFPKEGSSGEGETPCWSVEACVPVGGPVLLGDRIFHNEWRRVEFVSSKVGVPSGVCSAADNLGLVSFEAANALRWWFHAAVKSYAIQTRLVKHLVKHSYSEKRVMAISVVGDSKTPSYGEPRDPAPKPEGGGSG